ncbi:MAG: Organic hydroperoxide resistance transcriptional regulator [Smithella sp. PtaU1.Bin162]|nr:MAG: Organic hydroperoxide resistance transcriptional regulator [Smithella sp. PtaU1.Bin162]
MNANECIFFQFAKLSQLGTRIWGQKVSDLNITAVQAMILRRLYEEDGITSIDLGKKTELDSSTITGILDRLESACFIARKNNPHDRRSILIYLTEKGKITGKEIAKRMDEANRDFFKTISRQKENEFRNIISLLRNQNM